MKSVITAILSFITVIAYAQDCFTGAAVIAPPASPTTNQITLSWTPVSDAPGWDFNSLPSYTVNYGIGNTSTLSPPAFVTNATITNLTLGATYTFQIGVSKNCSKSDGSGQTGSDVDRRTGSIISVTIFPAIPTLNAGVSNASTSIDLSWNAVSGATGYDIEITDAAGTVVASPTNVFGTSFTAVSLASNTSYFYRVRARNSGGVSQGYSAKSGAIFTRPAAPTFPANSVSSLSTTSLQVNWNVVQGPGSVTYRLDVSNDPNFNSFVVNDLVVNGNASPAINGLAGGTRYYYRVRAVNTSGPSLNSVRNDIVTSPVAPPSFSTSGSTATSTVVNWSASPTATAYELSIALDPNFNFVVTNYNPKSLAAPAISENVNGLLPSTQYYLKLRATNGTNSYSDFIFTSFSTPVGVLPAPTFPATATSNITSTSFQVTWNAMNGAGSYALDISADPNFGSFIKNNLTVTGATSPVINGLNSGTIYYCRVRAVNTAGSSLNSATLQIRTAPILPGSFSANSITSNGATASWSASPTASGYELFVSFDQNFTSLIANYNPKIINVPSLSDNISGLLPLTNYFVKVRATNGPGAYSDFAFTSFTTSHGVLPSPTFSSNAISSITSTSFQVTWTDVIGATSYALDVSTDTNFGSFVINSLVVTGTTSPIINGLNGGTLYYCRVRALNSSASSPSSLSAQVLTAPVTPTGFSVSSATSSSLTVNWVAASTATAYELFVATDQAFSTPISNYNPKIIEALTLSAVITGLAVSTTYYLKLRATNATNIYSDFVNTSSATSGAGSNGIEFHPTAPSFHLIGTVEDLLLDLTGTTGAVTVQLKHKKNSENVYTAEPVALVSGSAYKIGLSDSWFDSFGMEYYFEAADQVSTKTSVPPDAPARISTAVSNVDVPVSSFGTEMKNYQIISIPYQLPGRTLVSDIFELIMGEYDKKKWRLFQYQNNANVEYSEGLKASNLKQGESYWFISKNATPLSLGEGIANDLIDNKSSFTLPIRKGWNQIGNPFNYNLSWQAVMADNQNKSIDNKLYVFDETKVSLEPSDLLKSYSGGFVFADDDTELIFRASLGEPNSGRMSTEGRASNEPSTEMFTNQGDWVLPIDLTQNEVTSSVAGIGMNIHAVDGRDAYDYITPPRFIRFVEFNSKKSDFGYTLSRDIVNISDDYHWNFVVESDSEQPIQLKWDQHLAAHQHGQLIFYDQTNHVLIDMAKFASYNTQPGARITIHYSKSHAMESDRIELGRPYPNPFRSEVTIPFDYAIKDGYAGEFVVYDLNGRTLLQRAITSEENSEGIQEIRWDGSTFNGDKVAPGLYLFSLKIKRGDEVLTFHEKIIKH